MVNYSGLPERLLSVRRAMKLTQTTFAAIGGVSKNSQIAYEHGRAEPAASYLQKLAEAGVNVAYLLTGQRLTSIDPGDDFYRLLMAYLELPPEARTELATYACFLLARRNPAQITDSAQRDALLQAERIMAAVQKGRAVDLDK